MATHALSAPRCRTTGRSSPSSKRPRHAAIHTLDVGPLVLPMAVQPDRGEILTVLFQGAVDRAKMRLPIFLRWRYQLELGLGPTLAVADPTLDLSGSMRSGLVPGHRA